VALPGRVSTQAGWFAPGPGLTRGEDADFLAWYERWLDEAAMALPAMVMGIGATDATGRG
jgi:hypothetical protein